MAKYKQLTAPTFEPVTLDEAKKHLRLEHTNDDVLIETVIIPGVRDFAERHTGTIIPVRTFTAVYDTIFQTKFNADMGWWDGVREGAISTTSYANSLELPLPPLVSIEEVRVINRAAESSVFDDTNYYADTYSEPGKLVLNEAKLWPADMREQNAIEIDFTAGYAQDSIPPMLKVACNQIVSHWYENRELYEVGTILARVPVSAMSILERFKIKRF